jgi:hypothetical protein
MPCFVPSGHGPSGAKPRSPASCQKLSFHITTSICTAKQTGGGRGTGSNLLCVDQRSSKQWSERTKPARRIVRWLTFRSSHDKQRTRAAPTKETARFDLSAQANDLLDPLVTVGVTALEWPAKNAARAPSKRARAPNSAPRDTVLAVTPSWPLYPRHASIRRLPSPQTHSRRSESSLRRFKVR